MSVGRMQHTATLLNDGTVLVVGGVTVQRYPGTPVASAEIYDPVAKTWHSAGSAPSPHGSGTASVLADGRVLVVGGGEDGFQVGLTGADLYNPANGTWQAAANLDMGRYLAATAVLPDGTVLVTGGETTLTGNPGSTTEIYQPANNTWIPGPNMTTARYGQTATVLPGGQVLVAGGVAPLAVSPFSVTLASAEIYSAGSTPPSSTTTTATPSTTTTTQPVTTTTHPATTTTTLPVPTTTIPSTTTTIAVTTTTQPSTPPSNLVPNPGFEASGVPTDYWGGKLARVTTITHSGAAALAQTASSSSGGWDMDANSQWYAPISSSATYNASIWVYATKTVKVRFYVDLLGASGKYLDTVGGTSVTLTAGTWTQLSAAGLKATSSSDAYAVMEPNFSGATTGTIMYWDDMALAPSGTKG